MMKKNILLLGLNLFVFLISMPTNLKAEERPYVGFSIPFFDVSGERFNGNEALSSNDHLASLPKFNLGLGLGFTIGSAKDRRRYELSYYQTFQKLDLKSPLNQAEINGVAANIHQVSVDMRHFYPLGNAFEAYIRYGLSVVWFKVENAAFKKTEDMSIGHLAMNGLGFNLEAGFAYYFNSKVYVCLGASVRPLLFINASIRGSSNHNSSFNLNELWAVGFGGNAGVYLIL